MKNIKSLLGLIIVFGLSACSPIYYSPNTQNVPLISEKGETNLTLAIGTDAGVFNAGNILEIHGAYGITNHIAIKANGGFTMNSDNNEGDGGSARGFEIGGGYFMPIKGNFIFETYGIFGMASFDTHFPSTVVDYALTKGDISTNVIRVGVQPIIGYKSKHISIAASSRIVNLSFNNIKGDLIYNHVDQVSYLMDNNSNFLVEPAITIKGGFEKIKLQIEYGYSFNLSNNDFRQNNEYLGIGLNVNFNLLDSGIQSNK